MDAVVIDTTQQYQEIALKITVGLGVGLLVGLEREWAQKEVGVRTFAIASLLGTLASIVSPSIVPAALLGVFLLVVFLNVHSLLKDRSLEMTTSAALIVMPILGVLVGQGLYFPAAAAAILMTMLLAWKLELARFADALHPEEIRGAVMLALLSFVIFPLLPDRFIDPYDLFNPRRVWVTVLVIAGIGFVNYVLLRLYSRRGLYYAALLGGLVNSTAAVGELAASLRDSGEAALSSSVAVLLLTSVAMFLRNGLILGIFARAAVPAAMPALAIMSLAAMGFTWTYRDRTGANPPLRLSSPVSLVRVMKFAAVFSLLAATGKLAQERFGESGFLVVSLFGGLISSASTTAAAATLVAARQAAIVYAAAHLDQKTGIDPLKIGIDPMTGGIATVLTSMSSALVNMPLVYQQTHQIALTRRLALITTLIVLLGLGAMAIVPMLTR